jgi:hypothetical protein
MRGLRSAAAFILGLALTAAPALAVKDCRSRLTSGLNDLGSTGLSWNLELRGFYYGVDGTSYAFPGLGGWLRFEPSERWSFDLEAVVRDKAYLDYERDDLSPVQLKTALIRYHDPAGRFDLSLGRQEIQLADGLVMDEFLDAAQVEWRSGAFEVRAGAGILALSAAKESLYCAKCLFFEYRSCWKGFGESAYGDFKTAFVQASASLGPAGTAGLLYQKVEAADPAYGSDLAGVFGRLNLPLGWRLGFEGAVQKQPLHEAPAFGFHVDLYRNWRIAGLGSLQFRLQDLYGSAEGSLLFSPTFGSLHLGDRQHYSVRQGHTIGLGLKLTPEFYKPITLTAGYYANAAKGLTGWRTDEIDAGLEWRPFGADWSRIYVGYARAATPTGLVHQLSLETRISF